MADRTVRVNCYIFSNISSGTAWLLQGMFTTETRPYNLNNQDKSLYSITMKSGPLKLTVQFIHAFAFADQNLPDLSFGPF